MIYNIRSTTHMSIPVELVKKLSRHQNIIGLKDSERDVDRLDNLTEFAQQTPGFYYLVGWAARSVYAMKAGADGIVPSTANVFPELYLDLYRAAVSGNMEEAELLQSLTDELSAVYQKDKLLSQALPALKVMLEELGICRAYCISPCYPLDQEENQRIVKNMKAVMERIER
jgi:dihydrodipicolinate synthase/N-acetylneuraminate lyase